MNTLVCIVLGIMLSLCAITLWATEKSRERTECYRQVLAYNETVSYYERKTKFACPQPNALERWVRRILL